MLASDMKLYEQNYPRGTEQDQSNEVEWAR